MWNGFNFNGDGTLGNPWDDFPTSGSSAPNNTAPWWQQVLNQGVALTSQIIGAYGNNPTQQIGYGVYGIGQGYSPAAINQTQAAIQAAIAQQQLANQYAYGGGIRGQGGVGLDDAATSITGFITRNPLLVAGGVLGVYLLMREPPRRR